MNDFSGMTKKELIEVLEQQGGDAMELLQQANMTKDKEIDRLNKEVENLQKELAFFRIKFS